MSAWQVFRRILFPQMLRFALPGIGNNWLVLLKSTAIVSMIGLSDMTRIADQAGRSTHQPFTFYLAVCVLYLAMTALSATASACSRGATVPACARPGSEGGHGFFDFGSSPAACPKFWRGLWMTVQLTGGVAVRLLRSDPARGHAAVAQPSGVGPGRGLHRFFPARRCSMQLLLVYYGASRWEWMRAAWEAGHPLWSLFPRTLLLRAVRLRPQHLCLHRRGSSPAACATRRTGAQAARRWA